jgi:hypothetical protein
MVQVVECLLCKHKALSSNSSPIKGKKKEKEKEKKRYIITYPNLLI